MRKFFLAVLSLMVIAANAYADANEYLNFTITYGIVSIKLQQIGNPNAINLQYSRNNGGSWSTYAVGNTIYATSGEKIYFRATTKNNSLSTSTTDYYNFSITGGAVTADGNIMSLLDSAMRLNSVPSYCFYRLFYCCYSLTQAPSLPAIQINNCSYCEMFRSCTSLTQAPSLPASFMAPWCYAQMFENCTSLNTAPALPNIYLNNCYCCYFQMFKDCISLTQAPSLPATTLANSCYDGMFEGCTSLTQAPSLPATTLAERCYYGMFKGCSSLTQAPALPATTLASYCYFTMFWNCTSLAKAPVLPATYLATGCYQLMFWNCTSLSNIPNLPATIIMMNSYAGMFQGCSSLIINSQAPGKVWKIPSNASATAGWNTGMLSGTGGTFTGNPIIGQEYYTTTIQPILR